MADQLTTEQVLLLNNLMYTSDKPPLKGIANTDAKTVGEFVESINTANLDGDKNYGSYMTGDDWNQIIEAVKNDPQLMDVEIVQTHVADQADGGGVSALFVDPSTNEAVVTFRGTASLEWKDNFIGGGPTDAADGVSTPFQEDALEWYQSLDLDQYSSITVTGHSKGGNKAKYITVLDDSVDRCLSFDGQGFSDEFYDVYQDQIAANQDKITNNNVEGDYVNILLNDIGETNYYQGFDYGEGGFLENHCPNTFLNFNSDGTFQMVPGTQDERLATVDQFLNSYLRSLSPEDKQEALAMIGEMVEGGFNGADVNDILDILLEDNNVDHAAYLAAYLLKYQEAHPELVDALNSVLSDMGMDDIVDIVNTVVDVANSEYFDELLDAAGWLSGYIPDFAYEWLQDYLKDKGIDLSVEELKKLVSMLQTAADEMDGINPYGFGHDRIDKETLEERLNSLRKGRSVAGGTSGFSIDIQRNRLEENMLLQCSKELKKYAEKIDDICDGLDPSMAIIKVALKGIINAVEKEAKDCQSMKDTLYEIHNCYEKTEKKLAATSAN